MTLTPFSAFSWKAVATEAMQSLGRQAIRYGVGKAFGGQASWNWHDALVTVASDVAVVAGAGAWKGALLRQQDQMGQVWVPAATGAITEGGYSDSVSVSAVGRGDVIRGNAIDVLGGPIDPSERNALIASLNRLFTSGKRITSAISDSELATLRQTYRSELYGVSTGPASTEATIEVRRDPWINKYFMQQWEHAYRHGLAAPTSADRDYLDARRQALDAELRPGYNDYLTQNQEFYRRQGAGVVSGREGVAIEGRNDWRDIKDMFQFGVGVVEGAINSVVELGQMTSPVTGVYLSVKTLIEGEQAHGWVPFDGPTNASRAGGRFAGPFVAGALPLGPVLELATLGRLGGAVETTNAFRGVANLEKWGPYEIPGSVANRNLGLVELDPRLIRTTQTTVKQQGETLPALIESMKQKGFVVEPKRLIDVVRMPDGQLTSLDTTRILAADRAGINVQARLWDHTDLLPDDVQFVSRFIGRKGEVPVTFGDAVMNRVGRQNGAYPKLYPYGSPYVGTKY